MELGQRRLSTRSSLNLDSEREGEGKGECGWFMALRLKFGREHILT